MRRQFERDGVFEDVFELADVAAIVVRHQYGERIGRYGIDIFIERFVEFRNKMLEKTMRMDA